jgi:ribosome-associated translation inhibitor RaiA
VKLKVKANPRNAIDSKENKLKRKVLRGEERIKRKESRRQVIPQNLGGRNAPKPCFYSST